MDRLKTLIGAVLLSLHFSFMAAEPDLNIFYLAFTQSNNEDVMVLRTLEAIRNKLPRYKVNAYPQNMDQLVEDSKSQKNAFFLSSSGAFWLLHKDGAWRMATLTGPNSPKPEETVAGAFIVRKDSPYREIEDLKGKTAAVTNKTAFFNTQISLSEVAERGYDPDKFFSRIVEAGRPMQNILELVKENRVDVGLVRAGLLESVQKDNDEAVKDLRVLPAKQTDSLKYLHSTKAYPGWTLFAGPNVDPIQARDLLRALLSISPVEIDGGRWLIGTDYSSVDGVFKNLKIGPYEHLRHWDAKRIWDEYKTVILFLILVFAFLVLHNWRSMVLVRRRTDELQKSFDDQRFLLERIQSIKERMDNMQKISIAGLFSSMVAHDLLQPLAASSYLLASAKDRLKRISDTDEAGKLDRILQKLDKTIARSVELVRKARFYVKREPSKTQTINVYQTLKDISEDLEETKTISVKPDLSGVSKDAAIEFDPFDFEILITNLLKNASESPIPDGEKLNVRISLKEKENCTIVSITNNGLKFTDEDVASFTKPLKSSKANGLGLGLAIVELIMQNSGDSIQISPNKEGGITVDLQFFKNFQNGKPERFISS